MMRLLSPLSLALLLAGAAQALVAQTADQARLMFTIGFGVTANTANLWRVGNQPFQVDPGTIDTLSVARDFRRSLNVILSGTYFPGDHLGFNVEAQLIGLASKDKCDIEATTGSIITYDLCSTINREERSATSAAISGGLIYRIGSRQVIHPYVRTNLGILITQQSFIKMRGFVTGDEFEDAELTLFDDRDPARIQPYVSFGGGLVAVIGRGYQFRAEVRDNYVRVPSITGPTSRQGIVPPTELRGKHVLSMTIGFDVVLERKRGRRY
ncbi:MAG TPA: hypothetical protein VG817_05860 [Gemmatimonadales bacterium]|nr:hypothetical protein [Gemmatimonadales bacterium]